MNMREQLDELKPFQARAIIEELRKGSVPIDYVPFFTVGRENWLRLIEDDLEHYIAEGGAKVRFINGDYGDGKTHFMSVIRHLALRKGFAVSFVVLTREVPMQKFEVVYREILRQLQAHPGFPENTQLKVEEAGIRGLVNAWADSLAAGLIGAEEASFQQKLAALREELGALHGMDVNFSNGLAGFLDSRLRPLRQAETGQERAGSCEILYQWFEGGKASKKELKPFQIFETLNKTNSKRFLGSLLAFMKYLGYRGLILLMDELETVVAQSTSVRNAAYENVRLLIDNTEQARFLHIFFSIIPDVIASEKGFKSYDALWSRVRSIGEGKRLNYRSVLIDLHRTPLETHELIELGLALRRIHEISFRWEAQDPVWQDVVEKICAHQKRMGLLSEVRLFIKQIIRILDMAEQGTPPGEDLDLTEQILESKREMDQEKLEQLQPKWDT
ncbi:MAG: DUF2791 family P-loop domain-containing protein [Desulfobacterales bacterium]|nr:DUF2791 family P-loop domain-containing protein [Desulfobacterales bacterium]